ncbi:MAG TPA: DUF418 domain-containing protein, partial [Flavisolibacter sp.]|nr:DUF418 domain-containing protein [Flavisolibacter sp.]
LGWYRMHFQALALEDYEKFIQQKFLPADFFYPVERAAMALGYASLVLVLLAVRPLEKLLYVLEAAGKLALTNYLMQTLVCTCLFYGYGFGWYAHLSQFQLYFIAAELILVQSVFSVLWLRYFNYGPAEWLLRRLSSGRWLPVSMRKPVTEPSLPVLS